MRSARRRLAGTVLAICAWPALAAAQDPACPTTVVQQRYFAEGATSAFFATTIAVANPEATDVRVRLRFQPPGGAEVVRCLIVPAQRQESLDAVSVPGMATAEFATVVESDGPVVADRRMTWGGGYGSHAETAQPAPATTWYFAEGATVGRFNLFYLLQNPSVSQAATVRVRYLRPSAPPLEKTYTVPAGTRQNIWVNLEEFPEGSGQRLLSDTAVSAVLESTNGVPIVVERAMYFDRPGQVFGAGHNSAGTLAPQTRWFLAEGATGPYFDLFVLVANPGTQAAQLRATYLLPDGSTLTKTYVAAPESRSNIWVDVEEFPDGSGNRRLADTAVSVILESTNGVPVIVERAMWWPGDAGTWQEGHNSFGAITTGTRWAVADGEAGGSAHAQTYVLVANASTIAGRIRITVLRPADAPLVAEYDLAASSRFNIPVGDFFPEVASSRFGVVVESLGTLPAQIVVERAIYSDAGGVQWAAGANALAARLDPDDLPFPGALTTPDDADLEVDVIAGLSLSPGTTMVVESVDTATHGLTQRLDDRRVKYLPFSGTAGPDTFYVYLRDGRGVRYRTTVKVDVTAPPLATIETSPAAGEGEVAVTRETIVRFSRPVANLSQITDATFYAEFAGRRLPTRVHVSPDGKTATLFYLQRLPASARVRVRLATPDLRDDRGRLVDLDGDGVVGGARTFDFDTLTVTTLPGTVMTGQVFASELGDGGSNTPLAGVLITVDGQEDVLRTTTDAQGRFRLEPAPVGAFFVHIDGRTATTPVPVGAYYPFVGKKWESVAGRTTVVPDVFLPLIAPDTLQPASLTSETVVTFAPAVVGANPELEGVALRVPADALFADNGARGGMVGIAPVAPDRLPSPLPPGLQLPLVITVQTDGATNFDVPAPVCFPNSPRAETGQPLPAGAKSALWSFNHDIGDWEIVGPMTVSADGTLVCSDEGVGIRQPGWHGQDPSHQIVIGPPPYEPPIACQPLRAALTPDPGKYPCLASQYRRPRPCTGTQCWNGCGGGPLAALIPNVPLPALPSFMEACNQHDIGWGTYVPVERFAEHKKEVDDSFLRNLTILCEQAQLGAIDEALCKAAARGYYSVVSSDSIGGPIYLAAQEEVSTCTPPPPPPPPPACILPLVNLADRESATYFHVTDVLTGRTLARGTLTTQSPARVTSPVNRLLAVWMFRSADGAASRLFFGAGPAGGTSTPLQPPMQQDISDDADLDGLTRHAEMVLGTSPLESDTDGDGLTDGAELAQGTNPLDGVPAATGVLQSVQTPGTAVDVAARSGVAVVASGAAGVSVLNTGSGLNPVVVAQVDTPGDARRVAFESSLIAVADGTAGLAIVDVTDPPAARITRQVAFDGASVDAVTVAGSTAYVAVNGGQAEVASVDLETGTILERTTVVGHVWDVAIAGDHLYALHGGALSVFSLADGLATPLGSAPGSGLTPEGITNRRRLSVGGGLAWATAYPGFDVFDVSTPASPVLVAPAFDGGPNSFKQVVPNGTGLGLVAVGVNPREDGTHDVSLYDLRTPARANRDFLTTFATPGLTRAVSVYNGLGFVADGEAGLQVVNYLAFDTQGRPPTIALDSNFSLTTTVGVAEEGKLMRLTGVVTDDVQVRNVEFFVNGVRVASDGNFPFEHRFVTPRLADAASFTVRACAFDTGGNRACTADIPVTLQEDATAPRVRLVTPRSGARVAQNSLSTITATFTEPVQAALLTSSTVQLYRAGTDGVAGTSDDVLVTGGALSYRDDSVTAVLAFPAPLAIDAYRAVMRQAVADLAGNPMSADFTWDFRVKGAKAWVKDASGFWDDPTNWSEGTVPEAGDIVVIDRPGADITVTHRTGNTQLISLRSEESIVLSEGLLAVEQAGELNRGLTMSGGVLTGAGSWTLAGTSTLSGGTVSGSGTVSVTGTVGWTGGRMAGSGITRIAAGAVSAWGGGVKVLSQRRLENLGTVTWTAGTIGMGLSSGAVIENGVGGVWDVAGDVGFDVADGGGGFPQTVRNLGTLRKTSGPGTANWSVVSLSNAGVVEVPAGMLVVGGPGAHTGRFDVSPGAQLTFAAGGVFTNVQMSGAGTVAFSGGVATLTNVTATPAIVILGGTVDIATTTDARDLTLSTGTLGGPGLITIARTLVWTGGRMGGAGITRIAPGATATWSGDVKVLSQRKVENLGTVLWSAGTIAMGINSGARIENGIGGLLDVAADLGFGYADGGGGFPQVVNNLGTLRKSGGTGSADWTIVRLDNGGAVEVPLGTLTLGPGTHTGRFDIAAAGRVRLVANTTFANAESAGSGMVEFSDGIADIASPTVLKNVTISTGTISGVGLLTVTGNLVWTGGRMTGGGITRIASGATSTWSGGFKALSRRRFENLGTVTWSAGPVGLGVNSGAVVENGIGGLWELAGDVAFGYADGGGGLPQQVRNFGTLLMVGTTRTADFSVAALSNTGTIRLRLGGTGAGQFDRLTTTSIAAGGTLDVHLVNGFVPAQGDTFDVITGSVAGTFATVAGNGQPYTVSYPPGTVRLTRP